MTAFSGIYSSLTGLLGFSTALDVVSENISNLNTPGFKSSESLFRDLGPYQTGYGNSGGSFEDAIGQGVMVAGQVRNFAEGQIQSTGNPTDLAINGSGFFILQDGVQQIFSRAGQFSFDSTGHLVDSASGAKVQAITADGKLTDFVVDPHQVYSATPTKTVKFSGTLATGQTSTTPFNLNNISVVDASGTTQILSASFTQDTSNSSPGTIVWKVTVTNSKNQTVATGSIKYNGAQNPLPGFDTLDVVLPTADNRSGLVTFDFADSISNSTSSSSLQVESSDGIASGTLTSITFDATGTAQLAFSNGKTKTGEQVALATFANPDLLTENGKSGFIIPKGSSVTPTLGRAGDGGFGSLQPQNVELANVDLGQEFANIIVLQRGYQGSSQVLNVSSQLLDTLYNALAQR